MELTGQRERSLFSILILINAIRKINQNKAQMLKDTVRSYGRLVLRG